MSNNKENLMALKEMLKNEIREDAQAVYEFEKNVNEAVHKAGGRKRMIATGDYVTNMVMGDMCDRIINSKMSMADKECILSNISYLLDVAKTGAVLNAMSDEERQEAVEEEAEKCVKKA